jgi:hypothetical protein
MLQPIRITPFPPSHPILIPKLPLAFKLPFPPLSFHHPPICPGINPFPISIIMTPLPIKPIPYLTLQRPSKPSTTNNTFLPNNHPKPISSPMSILSYILYLFLTPILDHLPIKLIIFPNTHNLGPILLNKQPFPISLTLIPIITLKKVPVCIKHIPLKLRQIIFKKTLVNAAC